MTQPLALAHPKASTRSRRVVRFGALGAALSLALWAAPASAGIIVTVGKLSAASNSTRAGDDCPAGTTGHGDAGAEAYGPTFPSGSVVTDRTARHEAPSGSPSASNNTSAPSSGPSSGWIDASSCRPIGGGLMYCDGDGGRGSSPGAGAGGGLDDEMAWEDDDELQVLGCQGSGGQGALPLIGLGILGLFVVRRGTRLAASRR